MRGMRMIVEKRPSTLAGRIARMLPPASKVVQPMLADDWRADAESVMGDARALAVFSPPGEHDAAAIAEVASGMKAQWLIDVDDTPEARAALARVARPYKLAGGEGRIFASSFEPPAEEEPEFLDAEVMAALFGKGVRLCKGSEVEGERRYVFGVVLEPGVVDLQGDTYSAETVRQAAHGWMAKGAHRGVMHEQLGDGAVDVVESVVVPDEAGDGWKVGDETLRPGTWLVGMRVKSEALWRRIKGWPEGGFSIGGSSLSRPAGGPVG